MARTRSRSFNRDAGEGVTAAALPLYPKSPLADQYDRTLDHIVNLNDGSDDIAWGWYRGIPELHYLVTLMGNALSMVRFYVAETDSSDPNNPTEVGPRHPALDLMRSFAGGDQGQSDLVNRLAVHLTVTGDSVIIGPSPTASLTYPYDEWKVYSTTEVSSRSGKIFVRGPNQRDEQIPKGAMAIRIWRQSPQEYWRADSPVRACFGVLREIDLLNQHVHASAISRLKGSGILAIPEEMTLPTPEVEVEGVEADPFVAVLTEVMSLAIKNRDSAAALVPIILRGPAEFISAIQHIDFSTGFDDLVPELRNNALRRLALGMDAPPEILLGSAESSSWCVDTATEILTTEGWKPYDQLLPGQTTVRTLNHETGLAEWQTLSDVAKFEVENEEMLSIEGKTHSSLTTMHHRWPVRHKQRCGNGNYSMERQWRLSSELRSQDWIYTGVPSGDLPTEAKYSDAFVELMAWFYTEGHIRGDSKNRVRTKQDIGITQSHEKNPENVARIRRALEEYCPGQYSENARSTKGRADRTVFQVFVEPSQPFLSLVDARKVIDLQFVLSLTQAQLELFIRVSLLADRCSGGTTTALGQTIPERLDAFEVASSLAGYSTNRMPQATRTKHLNGYTWDSDMTLLSLHSRSVFGPKPKHKTVVEYTGTVWCPVTPNGTWLARRNGHVFYTGNSMWQISEAQLRLHIKPLAFLIAGSLTEGWLKPALGKVPMADQTRESISRLVIWPDFSALNVRPDVGTDAAALHDQQLISDDSYRHILGLGEREKPDNKEFVFQVLTFLVRSNPQLAPYALKALKDNYDLPFPDVDEALTIGQGDDPSQGGPGVGTPAAPTQPGTAPKLPGKRSSEGQTKAAKAEPADGDTSSNTSGPS